MAAKTKIDDSPAKAKYRYQVKNWAEYDRALVNRGNLAIWFDEDSVATRVRQFVAKSGVFRKAPHVTMRVSGGFS